MYPLSISPFPAPSHSSGWCSHFLKALGPPPPWLQLAPGSTTKPAEKEQEMEAGSPGCRCQACGARPREGSAWRLPILDSPASGHCLFTTPGQGRKTEGQSAGGPRAQLSLSLGEITAFQCRSHFKLISLCIMFFKSFLNKTERKSVAFLWGVGTKIIRF